ncbi:MAG: patatin-like phospholipase family protein, partial [Acidimicrobiia bacterium]|nr:patatin-like phospholipase family protein [Acidimicrobiia bacterium]
MPDLFELIPQSAFTSAWAASVAAMLFFWAVQVYLGRRLFNATTPSGIVSLEIAGTSARTSAILESWEAGARRDAALSVRWDFPFLVAYALVLSHGCAWAARTTSATWNWAAWLGPTFVLLAWIAAACDAVEDVALLRQLADRPRAVWAALARRFAVAKFTLIIVAVAFVACGIAARFEGGGDVMSRDLERSFVACGIVARFEVLGVVVKYATDHVGFVLFLLVIYGIVFGLVGTGNGIPSLFWHDDPLVRVSASCAVTLLLLDLGVISYYEQRDDPGGLLEILAGRHPWSVDGPTTFENAAYLRRFLTVGGWPLLALLAAPAVFPRLFPSVPRTPMATRNPKADGPAVPPQWAGSLAWLLGIALGVALAALLLWAGPQVHELLASGRGTSLRESVLTFYVLFLFVYVVMANQPVYRVVSPAAAISALIAVLAMIYALVAYFDGHFFPLMKDWLVPPRLILMLGLIALFGWANNSPYKLRFPGMERYYPGGNEGLVPLRARVREQYQGDDGPPALPADGAALIDDRTALDAWLNGLRPDPQQPKPKLAVVAVSGGATRSAYWVATVLDRIEAEIRPFPCHVRMIAGASGGMVGAAFFVKELKDRVDDSERRKAEADAGQTPRPARKERRIKDLTPPDSLTPVARFIALRELWRALLPVHWTVDRGIELESDWGPSRSQPEDQRIQVPIQDLRPREASGQIPSLVVSPMMVDDGRRLLISNLNLWELSGAGGGMITEKDPGTRPHDYSLSAFEFFRLFPRADRFQLATAVRMSASFPFVSPAVNLPTDPPRRVVDAGYYDNYGVQVASAWIQKNIDWLIDNTSGVALVQIRDAVSQKERLEVADAPRGFFATVARGFQFFTSPLDGAEQARYTVSAFRNDQDVQNLSDLFTERALRKINPDNKNSAAVTKAEKEARAFFTTAVFENSATIMFGPRDPNSWPGDAAKGTTPSTDVALDWYVSQAEREGLDTAIPQLPNMQGIMPISAGTVAATNP